MSELTETFTASVLALSKLGNGPGAIARQLNCDRHRVTQILWRLRGRGELPRGPDINPDALPGRILALVEDAAPEAVTAREIMRSLDCAVKDYRRAIGALLAKQSITVAPSGSVHLPGNRTPLASRLSADPAERRRALEAAIIRRAFALDRIGKRHAAVALLNGAAERSHHPEQINYLALGDLVGAGEGRYRDVSADETAAEAARQGYATRAMVEAAAERVPA